jgi:acyl-CoA synthetase (AMP-forming)/AMP-acid ligase II
LTSYITGSVEFDSAEPTDAALICVPPYHIAGVSAALSNLYAGRKMVYLPTFDPEEWVRLINAEHVTTATVVPTMLDRIVTVLEAGGHELPSLRNLAYGGSKVGLPLVRKALDLLPGVGFVNAYGLTETSSTIAVLTPEDHRQAQSASDPAVVKRLASVGQPVPGIEVQIRDENGTVVGPGQSGELYVRGDQVSGRYTGIGSVLDADGWFPTRDIAWLDDEGYLFIGGRSDDTIIRGGENIAPAELEDVLIEHADVRDVAVVGVDDPQWGQAIVAVVVPAVGSDPDPEALREYVREYFAAKLSKSFAPLRPSSKEPKIMIKNGTRLASQVCDTQVIVVRSSDSLDDLRCGGAPMVALDAERSGELDPAFADGNVMGKRYVDETGAEVLVTKAGAGTLAVGDTALSLKEAKPLPASD